MWKFDWLDIAHLRAELHHFVKLMEVGHCFHKAAVLQLPASTHTAANEPYRV